ncbi:MAG: hypothetical protein LKF45_06835 [Bifidobacterium tibiigranuli]|nr:hypothetical protein [Bifidobacterium tibiigranuli]
MKVVDPMRYADVAQWAWRAYDVEPPAQVVLVFLAHFASPGRLEVRASVSDIAGEFALNEAKVREVLSALIRKKYLECRGRPMWGWPGCGGDSDLQEENWHLLPGREPLPDRHAKEAML